MKYLALALRVILVIIGIRIFILNGFTPGSIETCTAIGFIITGVYLSIQAIFGPKALLCPFRGPCKSDSGKGCSSK